MRHMQPSLERSSSDIIYLASSWRNPYYDDDLEALREAGFSVYGFKEGAAFNWSQIDPDWINWSEVKFREALQHHLANKGYLRDFIALDNSDVCILSLPCGKSAHLELGYAIGRQKQTAILLHEQTEPELMYKMVDKICLNPRELFEWLAELYPLISSRRRLTAQELYYER